MSTFLLIFSRPRGLRRRLWLGLFAALGCGAHPATQVIALFHAGSELRAAAASIHVVVTGPDGGVVLDATSPIGDGAASALARVPLVPEGGDASRTFAIEGTLLDAGGVPLSRVVAVSRYHRDELRELHLWFDDECRGALDCGVGRTCDRGVCVGACFDPSPVGDADRSTPGCGECAECAGNVCAPIADGTPCGCTDTDACNAGSCTTSTPVGLAASGHLHSCAGLRSDELYCWGSNRVGQLGSAGDGAVTPRLVDVGALSAGTAATDHTCWLEWTGTCHCWGWNGSAQLGLGTSEDRIYDAPVEVGTSDPGFVAIDSGWYFSCALTADGRIFCWGNNERGACAQDPAIDLVPTPTAIDDASDWIQVTAGGFHACGIKRDGRLFCWGDNVDGSLGVGDSADRSSPTQTGCRAGGCFDDWIQVSAGDFHTCAIRSGGELWCWGGALNGQLGVGATIAHNSPTPLVVDAPPGRYRAVAGGESHTCAIAEDQSLWCWGRNDHGQLGTGDLERRSVPVRVRTPGGDGWLALALGRDHTCAVRADETLWCWGWNEDGQLGRGFMTPASEGGEPSPAHVCFPRR